MSNGLSSIHVDSAYFLFILPVSDVLFVLVVLQFCCTMHSLSLDLDSWTTAS